MKVRKAVGVIVYIDEKAPMFILVHKVKVMDTKSKGGASIEGFWDLPKGGIKPNESEEQAVFRELKEELGIEKIVIKKKIPYTLRFTFNNEEKRLIGFDAQETYIYLVKFKGDIGEIKVDGSEIDKFDLFDFNKAMEKLDKKETKKIFKKAEKYLI